MFLTASRGSLPLCLLLAAAGLTSGALAAQVGQHRSASLAGATTAESSAHIVPLNLAYRPGDARRYGARIDGRTDDTAAFNDSLRQAAEPGGADPLWPTGTAMVARLIISAPVHVRTAGYATVLQQKPGLGADKPVVEVAASDVELEPFSVAGNIGSDAGEFNHALKIGGAATIHGIIVHGIRGRDIRGDVLYLGGTRLHPLSHVRIGAIEGDNIYRSVVSITGGQQIRIDSIRGQRVGYRHLDVEPNPQASQAPADIDVGAVVGADLQFVGDPDIPIGSVRVERASLDNDRVANSDPPYPRYPGRNGFAAIVANISELHFGQLELRGFKGRSLHCPHTPRASALYIEQLRVDGSEANASAAASVNAEGLRLLSIGGQLLATGSLSRLP